MADDPEFPIKRITIASGNQGKIDEINLALTEGCRRPIALKSILETDAHFDPPETGASLQENAEIKALAAARLVHGYALADDTGLYVDALKGEPGIRAARYAGEHCSFADNIAKMLTELKGVPDEQRTARFITVLALAHPDLPTRYFQHACEGRIISEPTGASGFGYDPIFYVTAAGKTFAEMRMREKEAVSHRGGALRKLAEWLERQR
ncbi:MAG TPA: RdgB/HAM1 family non-canonical purine NTP pyrophosphatase [Planctomycetota bacterium]|nr:RdgB/HAM1 family non-canonical purine NTP pyrophosphatase [Planctomycetota bacterium]